MLLRTITIGLLGFAALVGLPEARAQEQISQAGLNVEMLSGLPDDIEEMISDALFSGDATLIGAAITDAIGTYPDLAVDIASSAAKAHPSAAAVIAGAATAAVMASGDSSTSAVLNISRAVVQAAPSFAPRIAVAVFQNLPPALRDASNMNLIMSSASDALPNQTDGTTQAIASALSGLATNNLTTLTTSIATQGPVSGT
jgi:hypothetical protein